MNNFNDDQVDQLLKQCLNDSIPSLAETFDDQLQTKIARRTQTSPVVMKTLIWGYAIASIITCTVTMRLLGLEWELIFGSNTLAVLIGFGLVRASVEGRRHDPIEM